MKNYLAIFVSAFVLVACSDGDPVAPLFVKGEKIDSYYAAAKLEGELESGWDNLLQVYSADVDDDGFAESWSFTFYYNSVDSCLYYTVTQNSIKSGTSELEMLDGQGAVKGDLKGLLSSTQAIAIAQKNGGSDYLNSCENATIDAVLTGTSALNSSPFWHVKYSDPLISWMCIVSINAETGEVN